MSGIVGIASAARVASFRCYAAVLSEPAASRAGRINQFMQTITSAMPTEYLVYYISLTLI